MLGKLNSTAAAKRFLFDTQITDAALEFISNCRELLELDVWECGKVTDRTLIALSSCSLLEKIRATAKDITDNGVLALANGCRQLRHVELVGTEMSDKGAQALGMCCPKLTTLNLAQTRKLTANAFAFPARVGFGLVPLMNLEVLDLSRCVNITDCALEAVAQFCCHLHQLSLSGCEEVHLISPL